MFLLDYSGAKKNIDINFKDVDFATIVVVSGDEILDVVFKNGESHSFDSSEDRIFDFFDGSYVLISKGEWRIDPDKWNLRISSYDYILK